MIHSILLSGGTGFVGQPLRKVLFQKNIPVRLILRKPVDLFPNENAIYTENLFNENENFFKNALKNIQTVIHLAWYTEHGKYKNSPFNKICKEKTILFAKMALQENTKHFIGIGTCFEYQISNEPLSLNAPLNPQTPYGKAKAECYLNLNHLFSHTSTRFSWGRLFYLFGENENPNRLTPYIHHCLKNNEKIKIKNLKCVRDFLNTQEAAQKIALLALSQPSKNSAYNLCSGKGISIENYVQSIAKHYQQNDFIDYATPQNNNEPQYIVGIPTDIPQ